MSNGIIIKTQFNCDYVPISTEPRVLYLLIEIQPDSKIPFEKLPLNLGIVVDDSESMNIPLITDEQFKVLQSRGQVREVIKDGIKVWEFQNVSEEYFKDYPRCIDFVKTALRQLVRRLTPNDYFCLVSFASQAEVLIPQKSAKSKERLLFFIDYLGQRELARDLIAIITTFSAKLYGARSHKNKRLINEVKNVIYSEDKIESQVRAGEDTG